MIISTMRDLRWWCRDLGMAHGATFDDCEKLAETIRQDVDRPMWGDDWTDYLHGINVAQSILTLEVVR